MSTKSTLYRRDGRDEESDDGYGSEEEGKHFETGDKPRGDDPKLANTCKKRFKDRHIPIHKPMYDGMGQINSIESLRKANGYTKFGNSDDCSAEDIMGLFAKTLIPDGITGGDPDKFVAEKPVGALSDGSAIAFYSGISSAVKYLERMGNMFESNDRAALNEALTKAYDSEKKLIKMFEKLQKMVKVRKEGISKENMQTYLSSDGKFNRPETEDTDLNDLLTEAKVQMQKNRKMADCLNTFMLRLAMARE